MDPRGHRQRRIGRTVCCDDYDEDDKMAEKRQCLKITCDDDDNDDHTVTHRAITSSSHSLCDPLIGYWKRVG